MAVKVYNVGMKGIRVREQGVFTAPELITDAGTFIESAGGYYAGGNIVVGEKEYAIIIAPKEFGESGELPWKNMETMTTGSSSAHDGKANMDAIIADGLSNHPAAQFCYNLDINGFNDWHLPSPDELEICYRYLKPTTQGNNGTTRPLHNATNGTNPNSNPVGSGYTSSDPPQSGVVEFQNGGSQAFSAGNYWTSLQYDANSAGIQSFSNGFQGINLNMSYERICRAVRWLEV